jgi:hypothetical protein
MRSSGGVHPEWGYLAPAPNVMRTVRVVAVATAIGATASAGVVLALVGRPAASAAVNTGKTVVVVRSLVQPAQTVGPPPLASAAVTAPAATAPTAVSAATPAQQSVSVEAHALSSGMSAPAPDTAPALASAPSDSAPTTTADVSAGVAALTEAPDSQIESGQAGDQPIAAEESDPQKKLTKKHREYDSARGEQAGYGRRKTTKGGLAPFLRHFFFSARSGNSYYPN